MSKKCVAEFNSFDKALGATIKEIIRGMTYSKASSEINKELMKMFKTEQLEKNIACTQSKISRYVRGETPIPVTILTSICQFTRRSADELFSEVYKKHNLIWDNKVLKAKLPSRLIESVFDFDDDSDRLIQDFVKCIERREVDSKFAYLGSEVTEKYIELIHSNEYILHEQSVDLLKRNASKIVNNLIKINKKIRIVSLGIGDGMKDAIMLSELLSKIDSRVEFLIFDISIDMIREGLTTIQNELHEDKFQRLDIKAFVMDFMYINEISEYLNSNTSDIQSLFLLLGSTLGNFPEDTLLDRICSSMQKNDFLLIDNHLKRDGKLSPDEKSKLLKAYDTPKNHEYITAILKRANLEPKKENGSRGDGQLYTTCSYEGAKNRALQENNCLTIRQEFLLEKQKSVNIGNYKRTLFKGTIITITYSKKYTKNALSKVLGNLFVIGEEDDFSTDEYALILCKKKEEYDS